MNEILNLTERINLYLETGSGTYSKCFLNFTDITIESVLADIVETCFAMGNTEGGHIIIRKIAPFENYNVQNLANHINGKCTIEQTFFNGEEAECEGKDYIYLHIQKSPIPIIHENGLLYKRNGPINQSISLFPNKIIKENEVRSIEYEREFVSAASYEDLDEDLIHELINNSPNIQLKEPKKFLQQLYLIEPKSNTEFLISRAALLLFAKRSKKWHPKLEIRFTKFKSDELISAPEYKALSDDTEEGNIITLLKNSWEKLRPLMSETTFISKDKLFRTQILYPEDACYEALLNAIAHRDYSIQGRCIEIRIFEEKLEIISPGGLLSTINIEDLIQCKGVHESRNPIMARTLRELGYMRELGEGIKRIYDIFRKNDLKNPELRNENNSFSVILFHKYIYTTNEKRYLENFADIELTKPEKDIIRLGLNNRPLSRLEIMNATGMKYSDNFGTVITPLIEKGLVKNLYSQQTSTALAKKQNIQKGDLPRYLIVLPGQAEKIDEVQNEKLFKRDPIGVTINFIPNEITQDTIKGKIKSIIDFDSEIEKITNFENSYNLIVNVLNLINVKKIIENKETLLELNSNIKVFPALFQKQSAPSINKKPNTVKNIKQRNVLLKNYKDHINKIEIPQEFTNHSIVVKNLPEDATLDEIIKFFSQYGRVIDCALNKYDYQNAFIKFEDVKSVFFLISKSGVFRFKGNILIINEMIDKSK